MIEIEVQNETHQTQTRLRFAAVPRIGEGMRLREPSGIWASYDVIDVWYQKAEFGDVWIPYLHICMTPGEAVGGTDPSDAEDASHDLAGESQFASLAGEAEPFKI